MYLIVLNLIIIRFTSNLYSPLHYLFYLHLLYHYSLFIFLSVILSSFCLHQSFYHPFILPSYIYSVLNIQVRHDEKKKRRTLLSNQINNYDNNNNDNDDDDDDGAMRLRFEEGEGESLLNNNNDKNDTSNYTSYYDCVHNKEEEEEEKGYGNGSGDKSPLLPSVAQHDNSHNDTNNDSYNDDDRNRNNNDNNDDNSHNKNKNHADNHSHNDSHSNNQNSDSYDNYNNRNNNNNNINSNDEESEEEDEASVKTLLMESKVRSPYPRSSPHTLHTPTTAPIPLHTLIPTCTPTITSIPLHTLIPTHETRTELGKEEVNSNNSKKNNNKDKEDSSPIECSEVLANVLKAEEHSSFRNDSLNSTKVKEMSSKSIVIADEKVVETEVVVVHNDKQDKTNKGEERKEGEGVVFVTNMDEIKGGDEDSDSDCDTVPSPTLPPTLSTIPPSSAARKTLSMESRDPRISMSRRVSRAPPTAPAPPRPPRTSTQHTKQSLPRPFQPMAHDMDFRCSGRSSGSESDDSSSGSNNSSSGEEFKMPSSMTLQDTIRQRSRNQHAESALHSRLSSVAKIKKMEEKERERANKEVEKSDMGSRLKDGCAMTPMKVRQLCLCHVCVFVHTS